MSSKLTDVTFDEILELVQKYNSNANIYKITSCYEFAKKAHVGVKRKTGEEYIYHPLNVAKILLSRGYADTDLVCAALLHDVVEDTKHTLKDIEQLAGSDVAKLVDGLTKLSKQRKNLELLKAENLRKILLATTKDARIMLIKLADRLHNMSSLDIHRREKQIRIAKETMDVYAPLAEKLGLYGFKSDLEDAAFSVLEPDFFEFLKSKITATREERKTKTKDMIERIETCLAQVKIKPLSINGRAKHFYSIYKKMKEENKLLSHIYDIYGIRIITKTKQECYDVHLALSEQFNELKDRYKDYIKSPKPNGYQSLHTNIILDGSIIEIQIRTKEMDYQAESGVATHWKYKGTERDKKFEKKIDWLRQLLRWKRDVMKNTEMFTEMGVDIFKDEIVVVTPKGDPIMLEEGSTPIDFAFAVHTAVGEKAKIAKVNENIAPFDYKLQSGDIVEIELSSTKTVNPSWIGYAKQQSTIAKIRKSLGMQIETSSPKQARVKKKQDRDMNNYYQTLSQFREISNKVQIKVAKCCSPGPEDPIVAFYTKGKKAISVHKFDCPHQFALDPKMKVAIDIKPKKSTHHTIHVIIQDEPGVIIEVMHKVFQHRLPIQNATSKDARNSVLLALTISQKSTTGIDELIAELKTLPGVMGARLVV